MPFQQAEQPADLRTVVELAHKLFFAGPLNLIRRIHLQQIHLHRIPKRAVDHRVIMYHGVGADPLQLKGIEILNILRRQLLQADVPLQKIGQNSAAHHTGIGSVGRQLNGALGDFQPLLQEVREHQFRLRLLLGRCFPCQLGRLIGLTHFQQQRFRALLVAFHRQLCGEPGRMPFAILIPIAEHNVEKAVFLLQVSCNHDAFLLFAVDLPAVDENNIAYFDP